MNIQSLNTRVNMRHFLRTRTKHCVLRWTPSNFSSRGQDKVLGDEHVIQQNGEKDQPQQSQEHQQGRNDKLNRKGGNE